MLVWHAVATCLLASVCPVSFLLLKPGLLKQLFAFVFCGCVQIEETSKAIAERLSTLETERKELEEYHELDKERRGIEYALLDRDLTAARRELAKVTRPCCMLLHNSVDQVLTDLLPYAYHSPVCCSC